MSFVFPPLRLAAPRSARKKGGNRKKKCQIFLPLERLPDRQVPHVHALLPLEQAEPPGSQEEGDERGEGDEEGAGREGRRKGGGGRGLGRQGRGRRGGGGEEGPEERRRRRWEPGRVKVPGSCRERARRCRCGDGPEQAPRGVEGDCFFDREGGFVFFPKRGKRNENAVPRRGNRERGKKSRRCAFLRLSFHFFEFERSHSKRTVPRAEEESRRHDEARKKKNGRRGASE